MSKNRAQLCFSCAPKMKIILSIVFFAAKLCFDVHQVTSNNHLRRIINGSLAELGDYPYIGEFEESYCGASIISSKFLLSAAHCVIPTADRDKFPYVIRQTVTIYAGFINRNNKERIGQMVKATPIVHSKFNFTSDYNIPIYDFAVLVVQRGFEFRFNQNLSPIELVPPERRIIDGTIVKIIGWGRIKPDMRGGDGSLRFKFVTVVNPKVCAPNMPDKHVICTTSHNTGSSCIGRSLKKGQGPVRGFVDVFCINF